MRSSSANLKTDDQFDVQSPTRGTYSGSQTPSRLFDQQNTFSEMANLPTFDARSYAATSKIAARVNSANVSQSELDKLLRERRRLLDMKAVGELSPKDTNKLAYVRWSLDRIEDAKYGYSFDILEEKIVAYERLLKEISVLNEELSSHQKGVRK